MVKPRYMNRMLNREPMVRSLDEIADHWWTMIVRPKMRGNHNEHTRVLVLRLARDILGRWRALAESSAQDDGIKDMSANDVNAAFQIIYAENKTRAQGAIVAIVELVDAVGHCSELPKQFQELMT